MVNKFLILSLSFIILACTSNKPDTSENTDTVKTDTLSNQLISADNLTVQVEDSSTADTIPLASSLAKKWVSKELLLDNNHLQEFFKIDSIKSVGKYSEYLSSLDIGMTKDSRAWIFDTLSFPEVTAYVWGISYNSYEACPYFSGKSIYFTTLSENGTLKSTIKLTDISGGGDAPVFGSDWGVCQIGKDFISCKDTSMYGESGDDGYDDVTIVPIYRRYEIAADGIIKQIENKRGAEINKRNKQGE